MSSLMCPFCHSVLKDDVCAIPCRTSGYTYRDQIILGWLWVCDECGAVNLDIDNTQQDKSERNGYAIEKLSGWYIPEEDFDPSHTLRTRILQSLERAVSNIEDATWKAWRDTLEAIEGSEIPAVRRAKEGQQAAESQTRAFQDQILELQQLAAKMYGTGEVLTWHSDWQAKIKRIEELTGKSDVPDPVHPDSAAEKETDD